MLGNRYEVGELLGRGGMAEVHEGRDTRLGRQVAVKMLRSDLARDPVFQARFRREAQSAAALNHPNVVSVYDTGEDAVVEAGGAPARLPYIVMEYVAGRTARDLLRQNGDGSPRSGVGVDRAVEITAGVLDALEYSHRAGIVHRDIKPANVMITPRGGIKVMDFGIARAIADSSATMTQTQAVIGTAQYLSPEQARGEQVDARSDLYSAGCLLYELLTGRPPFVGDSPVSVAYQHVREVPQPPSRFNPDVDDALDRVVLKALAKDREDRYPDAASFREDLHAAHGGRAVSAPAVAVSAAAAAAATQAMPAVAADRTEAFVTAPASAAETITARPLPDRAEERRRGRVAGYLGLALAVLAVFALAAFLANRLVDSGEPDVAQVAVPPLIGLTAEQAKAELDDVGLNYVAGDPVEDSGREPGTVVDQTPEARTTVDEGTDVTVNLAAEPGEVVVPEVVRQTEAQARQTLAAAGLVAGDVSSEDHASIPRGSVIRTAPPVGESVTEGSEVALVLSTGEMELSSFVGVPYEEARAELIENEFNVVVVREPSDEQAVGYVISQTPGPGRVEQGTEVTLVVADPPATPTTGPTTGPTTQPTTDPTTGPTTDPTSEPTGDPTADPSATAAPTAGAGGAEPTELPTGG